MNSKFLLISFLSIIFLISTVFSANPDVNGFSATFHQAYVKNGSIDFNFNVIDTDINGFSGDTRDLNVQVWLVQDFNGNRTDFIGDFNLMGTWGTNYATCVGKTTGSTLHTIDFNAGTECQITFTLAETTDGNYWFDLNVYDYHPGDPTTIIDENQVRSQDYDLNFYIDNTAPTTNWDANELWQASDVNITLTCIDAGSCSGGDANTAFRIDTDSSNTVSYGGWQDYDANILITEDGNWAIDFNSTDYAGNVGDVNTFYVLIDQTAPIVTISSPTNGSSQTSTTVTLTYSATNTGDINKYYVQIDSNGWVDNSTNLSYTFNSLTRTNHTFYVIAQTKSDVNSTTASVTITITTPSNPQQEGGVNYCDASGGNICDENEECNGNWLTALDSDRCCSIECTSQEPEVCGNGVCTGDENASNCPADCPAETKETIFEKIISKKPTSQEIRNKLTEIGASENAIEKASQAVGKTTVSRTITVEKITNNTTGEISYKTTMGININNPGKNKIKNIKIIEFIPKSVALNASQIESNFNFTVLKEDPIIQFSVDEIDPNQTKNLTYAINNEVTNEAINEMTAPIVLEFSEDNPPVNLCEGKNCDDNNPCTTDSCNSLTGNCINTNLSDGTECETNKECKQGTCIEKEDTKKDEDKEPKETDFTPFIILIILIIIAGAVYYLYKNKGKNPFTFGK